MRNVKSKYFDIVQLFYSALVVWIAELLSERTSVPNLTSKYLNISE